MKGDYPNNTRYIGKSRNTETIVVEIQPGKRMIVAANLPVCLYFPYTYFVIRYMESITPFGKTYVPASMMIGFSPDRLDSASGIVGSLPLSNYSNTFSFCLGSGQPSIGPYNSVRELVETHINAFWKSSFESFSSDCVGWAEATKSSVGKPCVKRLIELRHMESIHELMGVSKNERFFEYQVESEQSESEPQPEPKPKRPSWNRPNRRKKRKGSHRKA